MKSATHSAHRTFLTLSCFTGLLLLAVSCLKDKPDSLPEELEWNPSAAFPLGSDDFGLNAESGFDTTLLDLDTITGLPEWVGELEVVMERSTEFDLTSLNATSEQLNRILFRINLYNGFPNEMLTQAYFMGTSANPIDSMFSNGPVSLSPGRVQGEGETIDPSHFRKDALFDQERIAPLYNASSILFRAVIPLSVIDTSLIPYYPYYPSYLVEAEVGAMLDLTLQF